AESRAGTRRAEIILPLSTASSLPARGPGAVVPDAASGLCVKSYHMRTTPDGCPRTRVYRGVAARARGADGRPPALAATSGSCGKPPARSGARPVVPPPRHLIAFGHDVRRPPRLLRARGGDDGRARRSHRDRGDAARRDGAEPA